MSRRPKVDIARLIPLWSLLCLSVRCADQVPVLSLPPAVDSYNGHIQESDVLVNLSPEIKVVLGTGPVCSYVVKERSATSWDSSSSSAVPFTVEVLNKTTGLAQLRLKPYAYLDCSSPLYKLDVAAVHCESKKLSRSAPLNVQVKDVNNHVPKFAKDYQVVFVDEGRLYEEILKLNATDGDCGHPYGEVCRYEITTSGIPFAVSNTGVLRNTQPLNYSSVQSYVLSVVAYDCGMGRSDPLLLTVRVNPICAEGVKKVKSKLIYIPLSGAMPVAPDADLQLCNGQCQPEQVTAVVRLTAPKSSRGCDRETFGLEKLMKTCGANPRTVDLLPPLRKGAADGGEPEEVHVFDGRSNSIVVPRDAIKPTGIPQVFSLAFWMRRPKPDQSRSAHKEHILCVSDDRRANRHHFAVYVKNCKMEMLFRRDHVDHKKSDFQPAEWRWHVREVCDDRWHYYSFVMKNLKVQLYVDGQSYALKEEPEILDDWPMHATKDVMTKAMIGACWRSQTHSPTQFFKGSLFGMTYLEGATESAQVFQCAQQCSEQLKFSGLDRFQPGERILFNRDMTELTLTTIGVAEYNDLLHRVAYVNTKEKPMAGDRFVSITTKVKCRGTGEMQTVPTTNVELLVSGVANRPVLVLTGKSRLKHSESELERGVAVFPNLKMHLKSADPTAEPTSTVLAMLNWCRITAKPPLDQEREDFSSPANLILALKLDFEHFKDGLFLKGVGKMSDYESVLRQIHYFSSRPREYSFRKFFLKCNPVDEQTVSDEFVVTVTLDKARKRKVISAELVEPKGADAAAHSPTAVVRAQPSMAAVGSQPNIPHQLTVQKMEWDSPQPNMEPSAMSLVHLPGYDGYVYPRVGKPGGVSVVTIFAIIGCSVLLALLLVGLFKFRPIKLRGGKRMLGDDGDLTWDDSGMNITVNPLEQINKHRGGADDGCADDLDMFGDGVVDNDASDQGEEDEYLSDDEDELVLPHVKSNNRARQVSGLEWDDSTLHESLVNSNCKTTYRV